MKRFVCWAAEEMLDLFIIRTCVLAFFSNRISYALKNLSTNIILTSHHVWHITDSRHRCLWDTGAVIRSATSFWKVRVMGVRPNCHASFRSEMACSQRTTRFVETLKGRLPIRWSGGVAWYQFIVGAPWKPGSARLVLLTAGVAY